LVGSNYEDDLGKNDIFRKNTIVLVELLSVKTVTIEYNKHDRYKRIVGKISVDPLINIKFTLRQFQLIKIWSLFFLD
jgi:hypothetical protein